LNAESFVEILVTADRVCGPKLSNLGFKYLYLYALLESLDRLVPWMCDVLRGCNLEVDRIKRNGDGGASDYTYIVYKYSAN
jgi:hypothetical protein